MYNYFRFLSVTTRFYRVKLQKISLLQCINAIFLPIGRYKQVSCTMWIGAAKAFFLRLAKHFLNNKT